jgi:hypothetical protein
MRSVFNGGNITDFERFIKQAKSTDESFQVIISGMSRLVVFPNGTKMRFYGSKVKKPYVEGVFLTRMVRREVDTYIEKNGIPDTKPLVDVQQFNIKRIRELCAMPKRIPVIGVDIDKCYWRTANILGYISDELYERGLTTNKKMGLLVAIGCLNKFPIIKSFENGELSHRTKDYAYHERYSPFYWNIIYHTYQIMMDAYAEFQDDFVMYLTDCLFVTPKRMMDAKKFFQSRGYNTKTHVVDIRKYDGMRLEWYDNKDRKMKGIYAMNRDISLENITNKLSRGMKNTPTA